MKPYITILYIVSTLLWAALCWNQRQDNQVLRDQIRMLMTNGVLPGISITNTP